MAENAPACGMSPSPISPKEKVQAAVTDAKVDVHREGSPSERLRSEDIEGVHDIMSAEPAAIDAKTKVDKEGSSSKGYEIEKAEGEQDSKSVKFAPDLSGVIEVRPRCRSAAQRCSLRRERKPW